jgi:deazaflavin-dependent oxidoreductase (nitroreductase family)
VLRDELRDRDEGVVAELRANRGRRADGGPPLLILTTVGSVTGAACVKPVCGREDGETLVIAATFGGRPRHPLWYRNLVAHPEVTVEYLGETFRARGTTVDNGPDRDRLAQLMSEAIEGFYGYQDRCRDTRQIPVVRLDRLDRLDRPSPR